MGRTFVFVNLFFRYTGVKYAKANLAFARFAFRVDRPVREQEKSDMRKTNYLRYRRILVITKELLKIILFILIIILNLKNL